MRFAEHLSGLLYPSSRDGSIARYSLLRKSLGSVVMIPLLHCVNEPQALALEKAVIQAAKPPCNGADWDQLVHSRGPLLRALKSGRQRPPQHVRKVVSGKASV